MKSYEPLRQNKVINSNILHLRRMYGTKAPPRTPARSGYEAETPAYIGLSESFSMVVVESLLLEVKMLIFCVRRCTTAKVSYVSGLVKSNRKISDFPSLSV